MYVGGEQVLPETVSITVKLSGGVSQVTLAGRVVGSGRRVTQVLRDLKREAVAPAVASALAGMTIGEVSDE
jgi:hypothetical protein